MNLTTLVRALQLRWERLLGPINRWPTWANEGAGGLLMTLPLFLLLFFRDRRWTTAAGAARN